jgi:hypothetical protein
MPESDNFDLKQFLREYRHYCYIQAIGKVRAKAMKMPEGIMAIQEQDLVDVEQTYA